VRNQKTQIDMLTKLQVSVSLLSAFTVTAVGDEEVQCD